MADGTDRVDMGGHDLVTQILLKFSFLVYIKIFSNKQLYLRLNRMVTSLGLHTSGNVHHITYNYLSENIYIFMLFSQSI